MALTVSSIGSATEITITTTLSTGGTITAAVGDVLLVCIAADNSGGSGVARTVTVADDGGGNNTYVQRGTTGVQTSGTQSDGAAQYFVECTVSTALTSAIITVTFSNNVNNKAMEVYRIQPGSGETVVWVAPAGTPQTGAGLTNHTAGSVSVTNNHVIVGMAAIETDDTITPASDTTRGSWSSALTRVADGGSDTGAMTCTSQYKIVTATGTQTYTVATATGRDSATSQVRYKPVKGLTCLPGSFAITGQAATLTKGTIAENKEHEAFAGHYIWGGADADLSYGLATGIGAFAITGVDASFITESTYTNDSFTGHYIWGGADADLSFGLLIAAGSYAITGGPMTPNLSLGNKIGVAELGAYLITGVDSELFISYVVDAGVGAYLITGTAADFVRTHTSDAEAGSYDIDGASVILTLSSAINTTADVAGLDCTVTLGSVTVPGNSSWGQIVPNVDNVWTPIVSG